MGSGIVDQNTSEVNQDSLPSHLGGHLNKTHNDRGALTYCIDQFKIKSFLDVGCGPGGMVRLAHMRGLHSMGIDGDWEVEKEPETYIAIHDFTTGPVPDGQYSQKEFDLGWSVEFLEHVEEQYMSHYMASFQRCVIATAAPPGYAGHHHVNCRTQEYWRQKFNEYGFTYDPVFTEIIRKESTMQKPFLQSTGMFYVNRAFPK
jgi:cyclopropane fatty-acyl-phospholipid synthase-like methyltransferase